MDNKFLDSNSDWNFIEIINKVSNLEGNEIEEYINNLQYGCKVNLFEYFFNESNKRDFTEKEDQTFAYLVKDMNFFETENILIFNQY